MTGGDVPAPRYPGYPGSWREAAGGDDVDAVVNAVVRKFGMERLLSALVRHVGSQAIEAARKGEDTAYLHDLRSGLESVLLQYKDRYKAGE